MNIEINLSKRNDWDVVFYIGPINEETEVYISPLVERLSNKVIFNLKKVEYINSCGVRGWINFIRKINQNRQIVFEECTSEVVMQINMIPCFKGDAEVQSVYAPYHCENCSNQKMVLFEKGKNMPNSASDDIAELSCDKCGNQMEMEELEEEFFAFLD